jgi:hypothetical protein
VIWNIHRFGYAEMEAAIKRYGIASARVGNSYVITSMNIRLEVASLGAAFARIVATSAEALNETLDIWRQAKTNDDKLAYGKSTEQLILAARGSSYTDPNFPGQKVAYLGHEQHVVWAMGASARTGCLLPPEFFIDNEAFGGTAGNGPNVLNKGASGERLSTIAMAHDTDWMIGRLMGMGPLAPLHTATPIHINQATRMGSAGLFTAGQVDALVVTDSRMGEPHIGLPRAGATKEQIARRDRMEQINRQIRQVIDTCAAEQTYYRDGLTSEFIHQGRHGWHVSFRRRYADFDYEGDVRGITQNINWLWDGSEPVTKGKNDVRAHNRKVAPFFPPKS